VTEQNPYRLPRSIVPKRYDLVLDPDLGGGTFLGSVDIDVEVIEPVREVVLNAIELDFDQAALVVEGREVEVVEIRLDPEAERVTLVLAEEVGQGEAVVRLAFRGTLNDKLHGFYRSRFTDPDGREQVIATTQFEATDARRAFPCWDEPDFKAVFAITIVVDADLFVVSNTGIDDEQPTDDGRRRVRFRDTMPLSTYLVAFIVGPLEATEPIDVDGTPVRVVCPRGKLHLAPFSLEVAAFSLRYFADYFDLPYPGDTLDLVAVPDFAFGAMENLGCVTFRETLLLIDPDHATQNELQNVVDVVAHELAHMWFGDLVTMKWWNGIWLNEAFATFMELLAADAFRPEWERWVDFGLSRSTALDTDALGSTRPVEYPVVSPAEAEGMFDVLTYEKGASVVRMLEQYLGEDRFREGIRRYMLAHRYANTETTDLWDALEQSTSEPVRRIMDSWIFQGGYPVVSVDISSDGRALRLSQRRFRYGTDDDAENAGATTWDVPLVLRYGTGTGEIKVVPALLDAPTLEVELPEPVEWVVGNVEGNGFYRVHYSPSLRAALVGRAQEELSALERHGLVDDTWAAVLAGTVSAQEFLALAEGFVDETDVVVWRRILAGLSKLDRIAEGAAEAALRDRIRRLLRPALERLGAEPGPGESDRDRELRGVLFAGLAGTGRDDEARALARTFFDRYLDDPTSVDADLAAASTRVVAADAGPDELDVLFGRFRQAETPQEEQRFLYALSEVRDPEGFQRVLDLAMGGEVRTQNAPFLIGACLSNRLNGAAAWRLVRDRWTEMQERFPSNSIVRMLGGIRPIVDDALAADIRAFLDEHPVPQGQRTLEQHLERMQVSVALASRERPNLA
jgi:puromycin-sensitive aminopeptidase